MEMLSTHLAPSLRPPPAMYPPERRTSDDTAVVSLLLSISKYFRALLGLKLSPLGLMAGQDHLLVALDERTPAHVGCLAERLGVRPSTISKMVNCLVDKHLVTREVSDSDARKSCVRLTAEGAAMKSEVLKVWEAVQDEITASISMERAENIASSLLILDKILTTRLSRLR